MKRTVLSLMVAACLVAGAKAPLGAATKPNAPGKPAEKSASSGTSKQPTAVIIQENLMFQPGELTVRKGTMLHFPNHDGVFHSVYCASGSQTFDLGLHATGPGPSVLAVATGDLEIRCRVHRRMRAHVHVMP